MRSLALALCLVAAPASADWPTHVVSAGDRVAPTGLTGADIADALSECSTAGGCIVQLECGTYEAVELDISGENAGNRDGGNYDAGWPAGLRILGRGPCSVLRSSIPPRANGFSNALIDVIVRGDLQPDELPRLEIAYLTLDGRSKEQPSPGHGPESTPAPQKHKAVSFTRPGAPTLPIQRIYLHDLTVRDFLSEAFGTGQAAAGQVHILHNALSGFGCQQDFDGGTGEIPCGCESALADDDCFGWNDEPDVMTSVIPGVKVQGTAVSLGGGANDLVAANGVSYSTKYGIVWFSQRNPNGSWPYQEPWAGSMGRGGRAHRNVVRKAQPGITCNGAWRCWLTDNVVTDLGLAGASPGASTAITTTCSLMRDLRVTGNTIARVNGFVGLWVCGWNTFPGPPWIVSGNSVSDVCLTEPPGPLLPSAGIYVEAKDNQVAPPANDIAELHLADNSVTGMGACHHALAVNLFDRTRFGHIHDLVIEGGTYTTGGIDRGNDGNQVDDEGVAYLNDAGVTATGVTIDGGSWVWGDLAAGSCSGFVKKHGASVVPGPVGPC